MARLVGFCAAEGSTNDAGPCLHCAHEGRLGRTTPLPPYRKARCMGRQTALFISLRAPVAGQARYWYNGPHRGLVAGSAGGHAPLPPTSSTAATRTALIRVPTSPWPSTWHEDDDRPLSAPSPPALNPLSFLPFRVVSPCLRPITNQTQPPRNPSPTCHKRTRFARS